MNMRFGKASENSPAGTGLIALGLDLMYRQSTVKTIAFDETGKENANLSLGYFDVPLYVQFYPFMKSASMNTLHVEVGAAFAGTLSRSPETLTVPSKAGGSSSIIFNINTSLKQSAAIPRRDLSPVPVRKHPLSFAAFHRLRVPQGR